MRFFHYAKKFRSKVISCFLHHSKKFRSKARIWHWVVITLCLWAAISLDAINENHLGATGAVLIMGAWIFLSVTVFESVNLVRGKQPDVSEAEAALISEASRITDTLILSLKLELNEMERAVLIQENYWKLQAKVNNEKTSD